MDPVLLVRDEQQDVGRALASDDPRAGERLARYLDLEERVLFDFYARHASDDDELGSARSAQADLRRLVAEEPTGSATRDAFEAHAAQVGDRLMPALVESLDGTQRADLGDALEEARQSWDEHEQAPHVRVGQTDGDVDGDVDDGVDDGVDRGAGAPGAHLGDEALPATPEPNEPA